MIALVFQSLWVGNASQKGKDRDNSKSYFERRGWASGGESYCIKFPAFSLLLRERGIKRLGRMERRGDIPVPARGFDGRSFDPTFNRGMPIGVGVPLGDLPPPPIYEGSEIRYTKIRHSRSCSRPGTPCIRIQCGFGAYHTTNNSYSSTDSLRWEWGCQFWFGIS